MKDSTLRLHHENVCVGDEFETDTEANTIRHHRHGPRGFGDIVSAYVLATWDDNRLVVQLSRSEIEALKARQPLVWQKYPHARVRKAVLDKMIAELKRIGVWT